MRGEGARRPTTALVVSLVVGLLLTGEGSLRANSSGDTTSATPVRFGETVSAAIDFAGDVDTYTFPANAGDTILIRMADASGPLYPEVRLHALDGTELAGNWGLDNAETSYRLIAAGDYTVLARDYYGKNTGTYGIFVQRLNNPGNGAHMGAGEPGETVAGSIGFVGKVDTYVIAARASDVVFVRMDRVSGQLYPELRLYGPGGEKLVSNWSNTIATISYTVVRDGQYAILATDYWGNRTGGYSLSLTARAKSISVEVVAYKATSSDLALAGDLAGTLKLTNLEVVSINAGPFAGKGFFKGEWRATLEGVSYQGDWQGASFLSASERKINLKGAIGGSQVSGVIEGLLTESVSGSGVYDQYRASWRLRRVGDRASVVLNSAGALTYLGSSKYPLTEVHVLQTPMNVNAGGDFVGPLSTVLTHLKIASANNPYYDQGFSMVSYVSKVGQGEGWTYDEEVSPGSVEMKGLFGSPLLGIISGTLDETKTTRTLSVTIERVDIGPTPDLKVEVSGPSRVSPGQTVTYTIEYRNDGLGAAQDVAVFDILDSPVEFISASAKADYDAVFHSLTWNLGTVPPKTAGLLQLQAKIAPGLSQGTALGTSAYIVDNEANGDGSSDPPNLFVNGINHRPDGSGPSGKYPKFANNVDAKWVEVYDSGNVAIDVINVQYATPGSLDKPSLTPTDYNGLTKSAITNHTYDTVYAYSGGTRTVLTAIGYYKLRCNKLVLISPMSGLQSPGTYKQELADVLQNKGVKEIEIYQSSKDTLLFGDIYQAKFGWQDESKNIRIYPVDIEGQPGIGAHLQLFLEVNDLFKGKEKSSSSVTSVISTAHDPNIKYGPAGGVLPAQSLSYKVEYENEGEGTAFGVYFTDTLAEALDDSTLEIGPVISVKDGSTVAPSGTYDRATRTITWLVGEVGPKEGGYAEFSADVRKAAAEGTEIINFATVHFPSVPEVTRTNAVVSIVDTAPPPTPHPKSPANGSHTQNRAVALDWTEVSDPSGVTYVVQTDKTGDFPSPLVDVRATESSYLASDLADGTYYWRVRAADGAGKVSGWSEAWSLTVGTTPSWGRNWGAIIGGILGGLVVTSLLLFVLWVRRPRPVS